VPHLSRARLIAATAAVAVAPGIARAQAAAIRLGAANNEPNAYAFFAKDAGFFDKVGLNVDVSIMQNGAAIGAAIAGGSLDIGMSSPFVFMNARRHGLPYTVIAPGALYESTDPNGAMVVLPNSPVRTGKDLDGATIGGITVGAMDELAIRSWIDQNGGDSKTVKVIEIPSSSMVAAREQGRRGAALLPEPQLTAAGNRVRQIGRGYDAIAKTLMISVWFTTYAWAEKHPEEQRKFADAMSQTAVWAAANRGKAARILEKWTKIQVPEIHTLSARRYDPALIQPICDAALKYKMIETPMNAKDFLWNGKAPV
jgi:ABC-type nitrate/sulfonate/bicarbonate transport system substrate-binding protein